MAEKEDFRRCPLCGLRWPTLADFVRDPSLVVDGYAAFFDDPGRGLVFVTHRHPGCGTTLSVYAIELAELYDGPSYEIVRKGADECRRLCLDRKALEECDAPCAMAWVRRVLQYLRRHELPPHITSALALSKD